MLRGLLPPGGYRVRVAGAGATAYRLLVTRQPASLPADLFEDNDSFERAPELVFEATKWTAFLLRTWGPGTYEATLHQDVGPAILLDGSSTLVMNDDYFRSRSPAAVCSPDRVGL